MCPSNFECIPEQRNQHPLHTHRILKPRIRLLLPGMAGHGKTRQHWASISSTICQADRHFFTSGEVITVENECAYQHSGLPVWVEIYSTTLQAVVQIQSELGDEAFKSLAKNCNTSSRNQGSVEGGFRRNFQKKFPR